MTEPFCIPELRDALDTLVFEPFREGVEIHSIKTGTPAVALLRYRPGARVPMHRHTGLETIFVLQGAQLDERGTYNVGDYVLNPKGSTHSVWSETGCVVLIQWERPVEFLEVEDQQS